MRFLLAASAVALAPQCDVPLAGERTALVTGITGMLGSHVAEVLLARGYKVVGLLRARAHARKISNMMDNITVAWGDMTDPFNVIRVLEKHQPDFVFHFAAQAFNGLSYDSPDFTMDTNMRMCLNLVEGLRLTNLTKKTKVFFAGSSTVYGATTETWDGPIPEHAPMAPVSPYGVSKASGELLLLQYWRSHGLQVVVGRFFIHLAPRGTSALALHEFARQVARAELGLQEPVLRHGTLSTLRDITDIRDSGPAVVCFTETAEPGTVVNVGSGRSFSMEQVMKMSLQHARVTVTPQLDQARVRPYDEKSVLANLSKFANLTGFAPITPLEETARAIVEYWRGEVRAAMASNPTGSPREEL
jgi:GDP-mannose 4,6-dehydratase